MSDYRNPSPPSSPLSGQEAQSQDLPNSGPQVPNAGGSGVDEIAGTVFSKSWVLALLVRTVEYVSLPEEREEGEVQMIGQECGNGRKQAEVNDVGTESPKVKVQVGRSGAESADHHADDVSNKDGNMDPALEEDLCLLWDASMNSVSRSENERERAVHPP